MNKYLIAIITITISLTALATPRPYAPNTNAAQFISLNNDVTNLEAADAALEAADEALVIIDTATDTRLDLLEVPGASLGKAGVFTVTVTKAAASTFAAGVTIPAGSVITQLYARVKTLIVSADANTIALGCASGAGLLAATDYSAQSANYILAATSTMPYYVASECVVTGTVGAGTSGITAGAFEVYAQYLTLL
jgi:hypothetical protein